MDNITMEPALLVDSRALLSDGPALRARAEEDGYLFFKGLLPKSDVQAVRDDLLGVVESFGWMEAGCPRDEGKIDVAAINQVPEGDMRLDIGVSYAAYDAVQKLASVHRLPHHPALVGLYATLFGAEVLVHPRHIVRMITPHQAMVSTPAHQDFPLIQGSAHTWTCWFPVGDCPRELGSLSVLRRSHRLGYLPIQYTQGAGGIHAQLCPLETDWAEGDFTMGDVLTFPCYTVHRALACRLRDRIRLSMDVRYQPANEPVDNSSLLPHCGLTWEEIYEGWEFTDLQYYWKKLELTSSDWDPGYLQPARRIC